MLCRWSQAAKLRRDQIESGQDLTHNVVFVPYFRQVTKSLRPSSVLEVGCGTGHLARELSVETPEYHAVEPSLGMFEVAKQVLQNASVQIHNATMEEYRSSRTYDLIISHMCVQMVAKLGPFFRAVARCLDDRGFFVFSLPHPCFYNDYKGFFSETEYSYSEQVFKQVTLTITRDTNRPMGEVPYYHRPIEVYVKALRRADLVVMDFDEILPEEPIQQMYGERWVNPRYCVFHTAKRM